LEICVEFQKGCIRKGCGPFAIIFGADIPVTAGAHNFAVEEDGERGSKFYYQGKMQKHDFPVR
jgi:hypothetical protein